MEWVETTGRTVAEAKDAALDQLGVDEDDADFEILEEPKSGLFGRVRGEARVRARVRPTRPRPKDEHGRRRQRRERSSSSSSGDEGREAGSVRSGSPPASRRSSAKTGEGDEGTEPGETGTEPGEATSSGRRRKRRRGGSSGASRSPGGEQVDATTVAAAGRNARGDVDSMTEAQGGMVDEEPISMEQHGAVAREFLDGLLQRLDLEANVSIETLDDDTLEAAVTGGDLGLLIGPRGTTLAALQELTRTVVQRHAGGARTPRVLVDVAGYRQKRRAALERFARQVAEEVTAKQEKRVLEPMQAADRKVVHDTINSIDGVHTVSEGEEPRRYVVILPG